MDNSIFNEMADPKKIKFTCQKTCGHLCCTFNYIILDPVEIREIARAGFKDYIIQSIPFPFIPKIGKGSKVPMLIKPEGYACSFMEIKEDVPVCILHNTEVKPAQCQAYPGGRMENSTGEIKIIAMKPETTLCPQEAFQEGETLEEIIKKIPIENFKKRNKIVLEIHKNKKLTETLDKINFAQEFLIAVNTIEKIIQQENLTVELFLKIYQEVIGKVLNKPDEELLSEVIAITAKSYPVVPYEIGKAIEKDSYHPLKNILETLKIPNNIKPAIEFFKNIKQVYFTTAGITPEKISKELKPTIERSNVYQKIVRETIQEVEVNDPQIPNGRKNNGRNNK